MNFGRLDYNQLKEIEIGDTLYDCGGGNNFEFSVTEKPTEKFVESLESHQLSWKGIDPDGEEMNFLITQTLQHYGPEIYTHKAYTEPGNFIDGVLKSHD